MLKNLNIKLKLFYLKWCVGHCPHLCTLCQFKKEKCKEELTELIKDKSWEELREYRKYRKGLK